MNQKEVPKLTVVNYPDKILLQKSKPVVIDEEFKGWAKDFQDLYKYLKGALGNYMIGIASPQAGKNIRCFIANDILYINPEIIWTTKAPLDKSGEGCLSLPMGMAWQVERPPSCSLKWQNIDGNWNKERFNGINARVIFHEIDHLDGKLCCGDDYPGKKKDE